MGALQFELESQQFDRTEEPGLLWTEEREGQIHQELPKHTCDGSEPHACTPDPFR